MPRQLRPNPAGTFHVMNRGSRRWNIFLDDEDRMCFLRLLGQASERFDAAVIAYALMGNHYHIVVHCRGPALSEMMQWIGCRYVKLFNRRHGFDGALFRSRFASVDITDDGQLLTTVRYVHRNPFDLDPQCDLARYRWSSHGAYLGWRRPPHWLTRTTVLQQFATSSRYQEFVETSLPSDDVQTTTRSQAPDQPEPGYLQNHKTASLADVQRAVARAFGVQVRNVTSPTGPIAKQARQAALILCADELLIQQAQIVDALGFSSPGALRTALSRARKLRRTDVEFATLLQRSSHQLGL